MSARRGRRGRDRPWWWDTCQCDNPAWAQHARCRTGCSTDYCTTCRRPIGISSLHYVGCPCDRRWLYPIGMQHKPTMQHLIKRNPQRAATTRSRKSDDTR